MHPHLRPLSTDRGLVSALAHDLEVAHDMDCAEGRCECRGTKAHEERAARGRAILDARKSGKPAE